jgi:hypothetical protein
VMYFEISLAVRSPEGSPRRLSSGTGSNRRPS